MTEAPAPFDDSAWLSLLAEAERVMTAGHAHLPAAHSSADRGAVRAALLAAALRMRDNFPYAHPLYAGQMLKPPHEVARLAYAMALLVNPNNHALDGGRASSAMEKEAVRELAAMFHWPHFLGHLTSGGTFANLEALWVAREVRAGTPGAPRRVVASAQAHYTHGRISGVLGLPFTAISCDANGRMDPDALARELALGDVGTVVATLGTTMLGAVDPLHELLPLARAHGARMHVDAAYGGYFTLTATLAADARRAFDAIVHADSIAIDPHKHGLQPYGCGAVLFRDPSVGRFYQHDSPYTYFSSDELHLGEISLECSRAGAAAVALWTTQRLLPLVRGGQFAAGLEQSLAAARAWHRRLGLDARFAPIVAPELDIVVWAVRATTSAQASRRASGLFREAAREDLHLALARVPRALAEPALGGLIWDTDEVLCLRSCLLKPEHLDWLDALWALLTTAHERVLASEPTSLP